MNIMKKRNIFLGLVLMLGLTGCYDLDKMPEGVLSTTIPFASTGEMRNYLDQFYQTGNYKYDYVSFGDGMRAQGFDAGGGQYIAGADTHSDNMASSSVSTRLAGETTLSSAVKLQNYTAIRNLNFMLCNLDNCVEKGSADYASPAPGGRDHPGCGRGSPGGVFRSGPVRNVCQNGASLDFGQAAGAEKAGIPGDRHETSVP